MECQASRRANGGNPECFYPGVIDADLTLIFLSFPFKCRPHRPNFHSPANFWEFLGGHQRHVLSTSRKHTTGFRVRSFGSVVVVRCWRLVIAGRQVIAFLVRSLRPCQQSTIRSKMELWNERSLLFLANAWMQIFILYITSKVNFAMCQSRISSFSHCFKKQSLSQMWQCSHLNCWWTLSQFRDVTIAFLWFAVSSTNDFKLTYKNVFLTQFRILSCFMLQKPFPLSTKMISSYFKIHLHKFPTKRALIS